MPARSLPDDPSLEHLRKQAKTLRRAVLAGDPRAIAQVREFHPRADDALARFALSDAHLVVARTYGSPSWPALRARLARIAPFIWHAPPAPDPAALPDLFVRLACLIYGDWHRSNPARAARLLREHPDVASATVYTAAAAGDVETTRTMIAMDPSLVNARGGPLNWAPLLYACYSRLDEPPRSTLEVARLLLSHGADANAGFLWGGTYAFTALTGAFGRGEDWHNQPPHPHGDALARLLLEAGADPNDSQALYNRHFHDDDTHLALLLGHGLGTEKGGPWLARVTPPLTPARLLVEELWAAAKNGFPRRVALLVEHGADLDTPGLRNGRTPYEEALRAGHDAIAQYLLDHGARQVALDALERFALDCIYGRRDAARAALAADPSLLDRLGRQGRVDLIHRAVDAGRHDGVRLIVELGVDVNGMIPGTGLDRSPLHSAAMAGDLEMVKLLLDLGADPALRDPAHHATPIAWARYGQQAHVVEYLLPLASIFDAIQCGGVERVDQLLRDTPSLAGVLDGSGNPPAFYLHPDLQRLDEMARVLAAHGVDLDATNRAGHTVLDRALAGGASDFADRLRALGARSGAELDAGRTSAAAPPQSEDESIKAFFRLVRAGQIDEVRRILSSSPELLHVVGPHPVWGGRPQALHMAVESGRRDMVALLLDAGADVNGVNDQYDGWSPLMLAAHRGGDEIRDELLRRGARVGLVEALMLADDARVARLLDEGPAALPSAVPNGGSLLMFARTPWAVGRLIALGVPVDLPDRWGATPVASLSRLGSEGLALVRQLVAGGATARPEDYARLGDRATVEALTELDPAAGRSDAVMLAAVDAGHLDLARWLHARGASVNARAEPPSRHTALHAAAWNGNLAMAQWLVGAGADVAARDDEHRSTPRDWAEAAIDVRHDPACRQVADYLAGLERHGSPDGPDDGGSGTRA